MTDGQKKEIRKLRIQGMSYKAIARDTGVPVGTIKAFCSRQGITPDESGSNIHRCLCCGKPVPQNEGRKEKRFCSDRCRNNWWNNHLDKVNRKANYTIVCANCGKTFISYGNAHRKYCSHECYVEDRFGGVRHD